MARHVTGKALLRSTTAAAAIALVALTGCGDGNPLHPISGDPGQLALEVVAEGLEAPVLITSAPDDPSRLFVLEKPGRVRIVRDGTLLAEPFLDLTDVTSSSGERGLLGLAFPTDYATSGYFFVDHTDLDGNTQVLRFSVSASPDRADRASEELVLGVTQPYANHNGGHLVFGPDGMLYVGLGDGGSGGDPDGNGQNPGTLLGSILRLDVSSLPYTAPPDNPFVGTSGAAPEVWVYGLRNPWRFSFDRATGVLWIADVGQGRIEEISVQPVGSAGGENYGWNRLEGTQCYLATPCNAEGTVYPVHQYTHGEGCSITGGYVYRGSAIPSLLGRYVFGDYCGGWVHSLRLSGAAAPDIVDHTPALGTIAQLSSFGEDGAGELYMMGLGGTVWRIVPGS